MDLLMQSGITSGKNAGCSPVSRPVREGQTTFRSGKRLESCPGEAVSSKWALSDPFFRNYWV